MLERISLAATAGFQAIEIQFPYDEDPVALKRQLDKCQMDLVLMNFPVGDLMTGGQGLAAVPGRETEFQNVLPQVKHYAEILQPKAMNLLAGRPDSTHHQDQCYHAFASNLRQAFVLTQGLGITLVTEPVNSKDWPGFYLSSSDFAIALIERLSDVEFFIQYDFYHSHLMEEDIKTQLPQIIQHVRHIQFSDVPGRTEPGLGALDFEGLFALIDALEYSGYVGAEYFPTKNTIDTFDWFAPYQAQQISRTGR